MRATKRLVLLALMVSQALILSIIESWVPVPFPFPGVKLGLANIITLVVIIYFGFKDALLVVFVRCLLASIFTGGFVVFLFSLTGGILSTLVMAFIYTRFSKSFSILGISIAGSLAHNTGQLLMASFVMKDLSVMSYLLVLLISGIIMGYFVGLCTILLKRMLEKTGLINKI